MPNSYNSLSKSVKGAWVVHHGQKASSSMGAGARFPALELAGKAALLLSQFASTEQLVITKSKAEALSQAAGLNPRLEVLPLLDMLQRRRVIQVSPGGDIECLGLTTAATVQHASDLFESEDPTNEEMAVVALAEVSSQSPVEYSRAQTFVSDEFSITHSRTGDLLNISDTIGFIDTEGRGNNRLIFNGNLFRRNNIDKSARVISSLSVTEATAISEINSLMDIAGCLDIKEVERILGPSLFEKLLSAGMYDINFVSNELGEHGFVTKPSAFHKFNDPLSDDAFDLAKALVSALTYGMTVSAPQRGKIADIQDLLGKLIRGYPVGPATAIGEDYKILEFKGVIQLTKGPKYGYFMQLMKKDVGEMALAVLTTGETASRNSLNQLLPGSMTGYKGPEVARFELRKRQLPQSRQMTEDVLQALRQQGGL